MYPLSNPDAVCLLAVGGLCRFLRKLTQEQEPRKEDVEVAPPKVRLAKCIYGKVCLGSKRTNGRERERERGTGESVGERRGRERKRGVLPMLMLMCVFQDARIYRRFLPCLLGLTCPLIGDVQWCSSNDCPCLFSWLLMLIHL
jgi:hypothetical protein